MSFIMDIIRKPSFTFTIVNFLITVSKQQQQQQQQQTESRVDTSVFLRNCSIVHGASLGSSHSGVLLISCNTASILNLTRSFARSMSSSSSLSASYTLSMYASRLREVQLSIVRPGSIAASTFARCGDIRGLNAGGILLSTRMLSASRS